MGRKEERWEQTKLSRNEDVEMGKKEDQVGSHQKWRHQEESARKAVETFQENKRLKWFGHCLRREHNYICAKLLRLEVSGRRSRGRPKNRWRDNIKGDMKKYRLTEDMAQDRKHWMTKIMAGPAQGDGGGEMMHNAWCAFVSSVLANYWNWWRGYCSNSGWGIGNEVNAPRSYLWMWAISWWQMAEINAVTQVSDPLQAVASLTLFSLCLWCS